MKKNQTDPNGFMDIFIGLMQATRCCRQDTAFCGGVTFHQFIVLDAVSKNKELKISDLHDLLAVEKSTTTRLINPLIAKNLLTKQKSMSDSRTYVLAFTKSGKETHQQVQICLDVFFKKIADNLPAGKQDNILQTVKMFITAIKNASGSCNGCNSL
jgi:DNA-binding MarR family transcriptional regulator